MRSPQGIAAMDYHGHGAVANWIASIFACDRRNREARRVFIQATTESVFSDSAQLWIADLIVGLAAMILVFAIDRDQPHQRRRWLEAWLLVYDLLDESNHAALAADVSHDPLVIDISTGRFLSFVALENPSHA